MPHIDVKKFEHMVERRGRDVEWQEAVMCTCWTLDSGQPTYNCRACHGIGYVYEEKQVDRVLFMSVARSKDFRDMIGLFEMGDAVMTVPYRLPVKNEHGIYDMTFKTARKHAFYHVDMYDIITLIDDEYRTSELLHKGEPMYGRLPDTLLNRTVTAIDKVRQFDSYTGKSKEYTEGIDFEVVGNRISWLEGGEAPNEGSQYSVMYRHRPEYVVLTNLPSPRFQDGNPLPRRAVLRYRARGFDNNVTHTDYS